MATPIQKRAPDGAKDGLIDTLRGAPATVPTLAALVLFVVWATDQAAYPVTHWAPGGLVVLVLLGLTLAIVPLRAPRSRLPSRSRWGVWPGIRR